MIHKNVVSSQINSIGYDVKTETLEIVFKGGVVWHYAGVPVEKYQKLAAAESIGREFSNNIKPHYAGKKIEGKPDLKAI